MHQAGFIIRIYYDARSPERRKGHQTFPDQCQTTNVGHTEDSQFHIATN